MKLHQYRVLTDLSAKPETTEEEREAIEAAIATALDNCTDRCDSCHNLANVMWWWDEADTVNHTMICRECADKGE